MFFRPNIFGKIGQIHHKNSNKKKSLTKVLGHKQVKFVFVPTKLKGRLVVPWKCLGDEETKVCVSFLELVSYVSPYVMCSVIASFLAAAIAGKAQQQHGGVSPASERASETNRPAGRASQAKQYSSSSCWLKRLSSRRWRRRIFHCCCCCCCCLFFGLLFINVFSWGVLETFFGAFFFSKFSVRVLLLCG